jgi:hypothetical protein
MAMLANVILFVASLEHRPSDQPNFLYCIASYPTTLGLSLFPGHNMETVAIVFGFSIIFYWAAFLVLSMIVTARVY